MSVADREVARRIARDLEEVDGLCLDNPSERLRLARFIAGHIDTWSARGTDHEPPEQTRRTRSR